MTLVATLNVGQSLRGAYSAAAAPSGARVMQGKVGGFSNAYSSLAASTSLPSWLSSLGWDGREDVAVVAFSAGGWALRDWLAAGQDQALPGRFAAVFLDALHGGKGKLCDPGAVGGVVRFGQQAASVPGRRLLVITSTAIEPPYASTSACAKLVLDSLSGVSRSKPDAGTAPGVLVRDYGGTTGEDHNRQQREVGPAMVRDVIGPWFGGANVTAGGVPTWLLMAGGALVVGAVAWWVIR